MSTITITYSAVTAPSTENVSPICRIFSPDNAAADEAVFDGTYYDTNVDGWGIGTTLAQFMSEMVAHPGLIAAIREAIREGSYVISDASDSDVLYMKECAPALASEGITIAFS